MGDFSFSCTFRTSSQSPVVARRQNWLLSRAGARKNGVIDFSEKQHRKPLFLARQGRIEAGYD